MDVIPRACMVFLHGLRVHWGWLLDVLMACHSAMEGVTAVMNERCHYGTAYIA